MKKSERLSKAEIFHVLHENNVVSWEDFFGVDYPFNLPYWIQYMPQKERVIYLQSHGSEFIDFTQNMLKQDYEWEKWQAKPD